MNRNETDNKTPTTPVTPARRFERAGVTLLPAMLALLPVATVGRVLLIASDFLMSLAGAPEDIADVWEATERWLTAPERALRRRFLVHPLHVCILYWPLMRYLAREDVRASIWTMPQRVTLPQADVLDQPGLLVDATGAPVRGRWEWSARKPLTARLRNREVAEGGDPELGQDVVTFTEQFEERGGKPRW